MNRFERALGPVLAHEGGYVNHPDDPGGATNMGITQRTYDAYRRLNGNSPKPVRGITDTEVSAIYRRQYWDVIQGDRLPPGVAYAVFDAAVNSGPSRAAKWLQKAVGASQDGVIGDITIDAVGQKFAAVSVIERMCDTRMTFLRRLRHWPTFGRGWTRRVAEVRRQARIWASSPGANVISVQEAPGRAEGSERLSQPVRDASRDPAALAGVAGLVGAVATMAEGTGPVQYAVSAVLMAATVAGIIWLVRKR